MRIAIVIPARYGSTRFPGKPLAMINGRSMLARVHDIANTAAAGRENINILIATDDNRIADHAKTIGAQCVMTPDSCPTGSDRVLCAVKSMGEKPDFIINLQGDAPFTPPEIIQALIDTWLKNPDLDVVTPVVRLRWAELDELRKNKKETPFSGTTCVTSPGGHALWFSKNIIPAIRKEDRASEFSPVHQHIGLYGFKTSALENFVNLPVGHYENLEGLEQLRFLENGIRIQTVCVNVDLGLAQAGVDSPEDLIRAERFFKNHAVN